VMACYGMLVTCQLKRYHTQFQEVIRSIPISDAVASVNGRGTAWYVWIHLYSSPNTNQVIKSRIIWGVGHVADMVRRGAYPVLVVWPDRKQPLRRPRH
jgi:hypothetical protein